MTIPNAAEREIARKIATAICGASEKEIAAVVRRALANRREACARKLDAKAEVFESTNRGEMTPKSGVYRAGAIALRGMED